MRIRKLFILMLSIMMLLLCMPTFAANGSLVFKSYAVYDNGMVILSIAITKNCGVRSFELFVEAEDMFSVSAFSVLETFSETPFTVTYNELHSSYVVKFDSETHDKGTFMLIVFRSNTMFEYGHEYRFDISVTNAINNSGPINDVITAEGYSYIHKITHVILGDVNGDSIVNTGDVVILLNYLTGNSKLDEEQKIAADFNADKLINTGDATAILSYIVSK